MPQDFAKRHTSAPTERHSPPVVWFGTGFICGLFVAFLVYVWHSLPADPDVAALPKPTPGIQEVEEMAFDFYEMFPESVVPIIEEYTDGGEKVVLEPQFAYLLQTGSFRDPSDADGLRAELTLLGLHAEVRKVEVEGTDWHRVIVGPLENELALNRAQDVLAQAEIASIPLRLKR